MSIFVPENYAKKVSEDDIYAGLLTGDHARAATKTLLDADHAFLYARNFCAHLHKLGIVRSGAVLDIGCGAGAVTASFFRLFGGPVWGIDMSPAAIAYARNNFSGPNFIHGSADNLNSIDDNSLALVHAREFYPFSRTSDTDLHMRFIVAARPKLKTDGLFCVVQIRDPSVGGGIHINLKNVQMHAKQAGFKRCGTLVMTLRSFFCHYGRLGQLFPVRQAIAMAGRCLEIIKPGRVSYIYWFQA